MKALNKNKSFFIKYQKKLRATAYIQQFLVILVVLTGTVSIVATGGGGGGSDDGNVGISAQITDEARWDVLRTYDQKDPDGTKTYASNSVMSPQRNYQGQSTHYLTSITSFFMPMAFAGLEDITTYTASGLVSEQFGHLYVDDTHLVVGNLSSGFSHIKLEDLKTPRGKVCNYRGRSSDEAEDRFGCSGFTKSTSDGRIYAWYGTDIVDVLDKTVVFDNAPDYTHSYYGPTPKDRFVSDLNGNLWVGTSNLDEAGTLETYPNSNGLYKISSDFSSREAVIPDVAIWNIFKDSNGNLWISANTGIYRRLPGESPEMVYDSNATSYYAEQIFEFDGGVYAIIKNFFHSPPAGNRTFDLYKWNTDSSQFEMVCEIFSGSYFGGAYAFAYNNSLYVARSGNSEPYKFDGQTQSFTQVSQIGEAMGQYRLVSMGDTLFSVGNITGVSVYNYEGAGQTLRLSTVNTSEGLIMDNTHSLYAPTAERIFIGPEASGFNVYHDNQFDIYNLPDELVAVGFFEHEGQEFIQGCSNLYYLENNRINISTSFPTNGEQIYYDNDHLWTFPNWGSGYGALGLLNMENGSIKGTANYYDDVRNETWNLDRQYHFHDIVAVPNEDAVFVAVGDTFSADPKTLMPYALRYDYQSNAFSKSDLPNVRCEGLRAFATDGSVVYGASRQELYVYKDSKWEYFCDIELGNDFRGMKVAGRYLFIISGWNSNGAGLSGGLEIVDLEEKTSMHYDASQIPIPTNAIFAIEMQNIGDSVYRLWLGTFNGVASCELDLGDNS